MKTIVMDSANKYLVVALYENQKCLASLQEEGNRKQSEYAIVYLQKLLQENHLKMSDFDEMVITIGPGSYTGVRVALTIAKTLNATMNIKVKTVSSLKAMAGMKKAISILDARSHKLFLGIYNEGKVIVDDCLINIDEFENYQKQYTDYEIVGDTHLVGIPEKEVDLANHIYTLSTLEKEIENKIKNELITNKFNMSNYEQIIYNNEIEEKINIINKEINEKKLEEHKLMLDKENIFPKIDKLVNVQEELEYAINEYNELKNNSEIVDIAKEYLEKAYKNMKENITPKFSKQLSKTISKISDEKYKNIKITDNNIIVETENGNYVPISVLSEGTIQQLYFSLRMAILEEISKENLPIFLDESFVFFDKNRLMNTINYLNNNYKNQIIIFSCTEREKEILNKLNIKYNLINM